MTLYVVAPFVLLLIVLIPIVISVRKERNSLSTDHANEVKTSVSSDSYNSYINGDEAENLVTGDIVLKLTRVCLRYRLLGLLVLAALIGWWIAWPKWTARSFTDALVARDEPRARSLIAAGHADAHVFLWAFGDVNDARIGEGFRGTSSDVYYASSDRSASDYLYGRQVLEVSVMWTGAYPNTPIGMSTSVTCEFWFIACRGKIVPDYSWRPNRFPAEVDRSIRSQEEFE